MKFNYQARTKKGEIQTGVVEAASREAALNLLQRHELYVTVLENKETPPFYSRRIKFFERVSDKELVLFSRQLAIMFKSRVALSEALRALASQTRNLDFKDKVLTLIEEVEGGTRFSMALSRYPRLFSPLYISMIKSGEVSGQLAEALDYLANHLERKYYLYSKMKGAMIYPCLIVCVVFIVLAMMIFFVIPNLDRVLKEAGGDLPLITRVVVGLADFAKKWGWSVLVALFGLVIVAVRYIRTSEGKKNFDKIILRAPLVGQFLKTVYLSRFAENLSTLISGGLPIARALQITGDIIGNTEYKDVISQAREGVRRGVPVSSVFGHYPQNFPPMFCQMILVGEKTGTLDKTLMNVVRFYQLEVDRTINNLLSIMEPALIVFLGLTVAGLMAAVLLPLYKVMAL